MTLQLARFDVDPTPLGGVMRVQRKTSADKRGTFSRLFCAEELSTIGFRSPVAQINSTVTHKIGAVRGMHFQFPPNAEDKLVSCLQGEVFDVAVDLRAGSSTFLNWHAEILSAKNSCSIFIPKGFAHGFQALSSECELVYVHSATYLASAEGALNARDPRLAIKWPLPISEISDKDDSHPFLDDYFCGVL
jgi:dTDP-4-dehydrorhamnose 3,5-epimerase